MIRASTGCLHVHHQPVDIMMVSSSVVMLRTSTTVIIIRLLYCSDSCRLPASPLSSLDLYKCYCHHAQHLRHLLGIKGWYFPVKYFILKFVSSFSNLLDLYRIYIYVVIAILHNILDPSLVSSGDISQSSILSSLCFCYFKPNNTFMLFPLCIAQWNLCCSKYLLNPGLFRLLLVYLT